ncbi:MAG: glycosyltransferase [Planctomycetota bacterium]
MACSHSRDDPASRFRVVQYLPHVAAAGWEVTHRPNVPSRYWRPRRPLRWLRSIERRTAVGLRRWNRRRDIRDAADCDVVFLNRDLQEGAAVWERRLFAANPRVVFDFDDAIHLGAEKRAHIGWVCRQAAWVTPGNETLAAFAREFTDRATVTPSTVPIERYELHPLPGGAAVSAAGGPPRVGWLGSDLSIRETLFPRWELLGRLQRAIGFEFVICSQPRPTPPAGPLQWRFVEWSPAVEERIGRHVDIGIMPLEDDAFQRGKCGMKLLQYMAAGLPVVASPVGVNAAIVAHGETGFLAATEQEWHAAVAALAADAALRRRLGLAGRERCERSYSTSVWAPRLLEIFARVAARA